MAIFIDATNSIKTRWRRVAACDDFLGKNGEGKCGVRGRLGRQPNRAVSRRRGVVDDLSEIRLSLVDKAVEKEGDTPAFARQ